MKRRTLSLLLAGALALALSACVNGRKVFGGPAKESVLKQIEIIESFLDSLNK